VPQKGMPGGGSRSTDIISEADLARHLPEQTVDQFVEIIRASP